MGASPLVVVLHDIRSVHNVGSIFRTADAAGVTKIILSGYTPQPIDRFRRPRPDFIKVSLGAEHSVPWEYAESLDTTLAHLKDEHYTVLALEQDARSVPLFSWASTPGQPVALLVGNEVDGIAPETLAQADSILEIPMRGIKESLNVSVAAGIALFALREQLR